MAKQDKISRSGFVIKLSTETANKLAEEEQIAKLKAEEAVIKGNKKDTTQQDEKCVSKFIDTQPADKQYCSVEPVAVTPPDETIPLNSKDVDKKSTISGDSSKTEIITEKSDESSDSTHPSWGEYAPYVTYEGEKAIYTDPSTKQRYTWRQETNSWVTIESEASKAYSYEDDTHVYTEADGSKFFWDDEKKAWIPKVDDEFLAYYQMSYGFVDNKPEEKKEDDKQKEVQKKVENAAAGVKRKNEPQWFEPSQDTNTKVYVSNLPLDISEEEFVNFMQKCGLVERDPHTQKMKVKLYMDKEQNCFKGDALCTYIKIESVDLALNLLDGSDFKGSKVKVEKAHFELKGDYNPALKPKKKKKKELEKIKKMQQKLFDWRPEKFIGERSKHERVVIIKNLFHPTDFDKEVQLILDYQQDLREEATKCGEVRKVVMYDRHPEGVAQITMKEPEMADAVVELMNRRWFGKRQITAEIWDGRTKYRIAETDADIGKRIDKWEKFLEGKEDNADSSKPIQECSTSEPKVDTSVMEAIHENSLPRGDIVSVESKPSKDSTATVMERDASETSDQKN